MISAPPAHRLAALDFIRGFALLGILIVNAMAFAWPIEVYSNPARSSLAMTEADRMTWWTIHTFFESKCITLFAMLFGISLFLVRQQDEPQTPFTRTILFRRLMWLIGFGLLHGAAIWLGDILLMYAVVGLFFVSVVKTKHYLRWGVGLYVIGSLMILAPGWLLALLPRDEVGALISGSSVMTFAQSVEMMRGSFAESLYGNFAMWATIITSQITVYGLKIIALLMIGLGLFKVGYFETKGKTAWHLLCIGLGGACLAVIGYQNSLTVAAGFPEPEIYGSLKAANEFLSVFVSLGYASLLILISRLPVLSLITTALQPVGRMAFTNYLMQSLIMTAIFYGGRGLGLYGTLGHAQLVPIVAGVWAFQIVFSHLWLRVFRYGPFEWVWRSLSHGKFMPIR